MNQVSPEINVTSTQTEIGDHLPKITVTSTQTRIGDQVFDNHVVMAVLLDENDVDVTSLDEYPKIGTKIKTLCYTIDSTKTVFHETIINANVRPLPQKLQKIASFLLKFLKWTSTILAAKVTIDHALAKLDGTDPTKEALIIYNEGKIDSNPILKAIEDTDEDEMFKNMHIIGTITIAGKIHMLLRLQFQGYSILFFDISQTLKVT
jgi:hypothetical protein